MSIIGNGSASGETRSMQQRVDTALTELKVDRKARDAGVKNNPPTDSTSLDANQQEIIGYFTAQLGQRKGEAEKRLEQLTVERKAVAGKIDIDQTKNSFSRLLNAVEPGLERLKGDHATVVHQAKENEERSLRQLRYFQQEHGLYQRAATYPDSLIRHFAIVAILAVLEWISLATFYAEGSDFGLLGGVLIAMVLSITNVALAILAGSLLRYLNHKSVARKLLAITGVAFLAAFFVLITLGAAHYRAATNEIAQSQQGAVRPSRETDTVDAGVASTEADQWRAAKLAWRRFTENPVGFQDVFSWILVILTSLFGIFAAYKGYRIDDPYPGYGERDRNLKNMRGIYDGEKRKYTQAVDEFFDRTLRDQGRLLSEAKTNIDYYHQLASKTSDELRGFEREAGEIQDACNIVVAHYRQRNREVASARRPAYFEQSTSLHQRLMTTPERLLAEEVELRRPTASNVGCR